MIFGEIEHLAYGGSGILRADGMVIFVPFTAPKDKLFINIIKQKKNHAIATINSLEEKGPLRVIPRCPHFMECGGCQFQHLDYQLQLLAKQQFVEEALKRQAGIIFPIQSIVPSPKIWGYRKHIRLNLKPKNSGFEAGYIGTDFLPISQCYLFEENSENFFKTMQEGLLELSNEGIQEASLRLFKTSQSILFAFSFFPYLPKNCKEIFSQFPYPVVAQSPRQKREFGNIETHFILSGLQFFYSPYSFLQNNLAQSEQLYNTILSLTTSKEILDLYCGIGITSLLFARKGATVIGIESNINAVKLAQKNALYNRVNNVQFICSEVEKVSLSKSYTLLVNPPRTGLSKEAMNKILQCNPQEILYVSCMPSTLARDLKILLASGYTLNFIQPFDMFPQTTHVETLVHIKKA